MRDKDSQLIFESYRKRVILNEAAPALVFPAAGIGIAEVLGLAATVVGATALASTISEKKDEISRLFKLTPVTSDKIQEFDKLIKNPDFSLRGIYTLLNFAKSLGVPVLTSLLEFGYQSIKSLQYDIENAVEPLTRIQTFKTVLSGLKEQCEKIIQLISKSGIDESISSPIISELNGIISEIASMMLRIEATGKDAKWLLDRDRGSSTGGGGGPKPPYDNIWSKIGNVIKACFQFITKTWFRLIVFIIIIGLIILFGAPELVGAGIVQGGRSAIETGEKLWSGAKTEYGKGDVEKTKPPTDKWIPETPNLPKEKSNSSSEAAPTPIPFKRNKG